MHWEPTAHGYRHSDSSGYPAGPAAPLVLRPAARVRWATVIVSVVPSVALLPQVAEVAEVPVVVATAAAEALLCVLLLVRAFRMRTVVTEHHIETQTFFRHRVRARADAAKVVRAVLIPPRGPAFPVVFVLSSQGTVLARLNGGTYPEEALERLVAHLRLPTGGPSQPVTASQLARDYPGIVPYVEERPFLTGCLMSLVVICLMIVIGMIMTLTMWS